MAPNSTKIALAAANAVLHRRRGPGVHDQAKHLSAGCIILGINPLVIGSADQHKLAWTGQAHWRQGLVPRLKKIPEGNHRVNIIVTLPMTTKNSAATSLHNLALRFFLE